MDNSTQQTELLMRYLDGEMRGMEKDEFEERLASDEGLQQELAGLQMAKDAVKLFGLKQHIASVRSEMKEAGTGVVVRKMSTIRSIVRYGLAVAAGILVIAISVLAYSFFSLSPGKLFSEKYNAFELSTLRGGAETSTAIDDAYREKKYSDVVNLSAKKTGLTVEDKFLAGVSYLELDSMSKSITILKEVINEDQHADRPVYKDEAEYYLALSYLKNRDYDKAIDLMTAIHNDPNNLYHQTFTAGFIRKVKMLKWR